MLWNLAATLLAFASQVADPASTGPQDAGADASAPESPAAAPADASDAPPPRVAIVGATVHTLEPDSEPRMATVLVEGTRIAAVEPGLELRPGTVRFDGAGLHVVPGLIDGLASIDPDQDALYVSHGVTTVCDPGSDVALLTALREPEIRDAVPGPAILTAGAVFDGDPPRSPMAVVVQDPARVPAVVDLLVQRPGVEFLNAQPGLGEAGLAALCEAGAARGLEVWGQGSRELPFERLVELGQRGFFGLDVLLPPGVEWTFVLPTAFRRGIELAAREGVVFQPMLGMHLRAMEPVEPDSRLELLSPEYAVTWARELEVRARAQSDPEFGAEARRVFRKTADLTRQLHAAGVRLVPGSSAPMQAGAFPGASLIDELEAWVEAGFAREQALAAATRGAASAFGLEDRGRIEVGAIADLVVLDRDPRESLVGFRSPAAVVVRGRLLDRLTLEDLVETVRVAQARVREEQARPIEIPLPELPEGEALLMSGQVETRSFGMRLSSEAYTVAALPGDRLILRGRLVAPALGRVAASEMEIEQILLEGKLDSFRLRVQRGDQTLQVDGALEASRFLLRRMLDGQPVDTVALVERPALINLSAMADSVTTALALGQRERDGATTVLAFGDSFEPVLTRWNLATAEGFERVARTHQGTMVWRFGAQGRLEEWLRVAGRSVTTTRPIRFEAYGGGGLPVAFEPGAPREAAAPAEASATVGDGEAGDGGGDAAGAGSQQQGPTPGDSPADERPAEPSAEASGGGGADG